MTKKWTCEDFANTMKSLLDMRKISIHNYLVFDQGDGGIIFATYYDDKPGYALMINNLANENLVCNIDGSAMLLDKQDIVEGAEGPVLHMNADFSSITFQMSGEVTNVIEFKMGEDTGRSHITHPEVAFGVLLESLDEVCSSAVATRPGSSTFISEADEAAAARGGGGVGAAAGAGSGSAQEPSPSTHLEATTATRGVGGVGAAAGAGSGVRG